MKRLVYDRAQVDSVRNIDDNGYLHVGISNITKEQVAPYLGSEIPDFEKLGLKPDEIYSVYRPASELSKPATVESLNGIPVLLKHAEDSAEAPASNRVGSTGTDAKWEPPYLTNSLHIQDADAIRRINDGTMREISMGYFYTPVLRHGEFEGEPYDVVMTDISCNHVALVEEGRAGHDVSVKDSTLTLPAGGGKEEPKTSSELKQENDDMNEKEKALAEILEIVAGAGIDPEAFKQKLDAVINIKDDSQTTDEDTEESKAFAEGVEYGEEKEKEDPEKLDREHESEGEERYLEEKNETEDSDEEKDLTADAEEALKSCGLDADDPTVKAAFQQGFASGVSYGEEKEKDEPKKLDSEHESEGEKKALGQDSAAKIGAIVRAQVEAKFDAIQETSKSLGRVRASAFDTAADVYRAALKAEGVNVTGLAKRECRTAYRALMMGRQSAKRVAAMDSKPHKPDALSKMLNSIRVGE